MFVCMRVCDGLAWDFGKAQEAKFHIKGNVGWEAALYALRGLQPPGSRAL